jgi:hypothetical protein
VPDSIRFQITLDAWTRAQLGSDRAVTAWLNDALREALMEKLAELPGPLPRDIFISIKPVASTTRKV